MNQMVVKKGTIVESLEEKSKQRPSTVKKNEVALQRTTVSWYGDKSRDKLFALLPPVLFPVRRSRLEEALTLREIAERGRCSLLEQRQLPGGIPYWARWKSHASRAQLRSLKV